MYLAYRPGGEDDASGLYKMRFPLGSSKLKIPIGLYKIRLTARSNNFYQKNRHNIHFPQFSDWLRFNIVALYHKLNYHMKVIPVSFRLLVEICLILVAICLPLLL